jgi:hypothetical protein
MGCSLRASENCDQFIPLSGGPVLEVTPTAWKVLSVNDPGDRIWATPAIADGRI